MSILVCPIMALTTSYNFMCQLKAVQCSPSPPRDDPRPQRLTSLSSAQAPTAKSLWLHWWHQGLIGCVSGGWGVVTRGQNAFVTASLWGRHLLALTSLRLEKTEAVVGDAWGGGLRRWRIDCGSWQLRYFWVGRSMEVNCGQTFTLEACLHLRLKWVREGLPFLPSFPYSVKDFMQSHTIFAANQPSRHQWNSRKF